MYKHILIPTDGSDRAQVSVAQGIELAIEIGAQITVVTVSEPFHASIVEPMRVRETLDAHDREADINATRVLDRASNAARAVGVNCSAVHVRHESVSTAIIEIAAQKGCDLIVMTSDRRHGMSAILHESKTVQVLKHCNIPVLVL
jgi:nucleotide-binding universal stress UspA family protein